MPSRPLPNLLLESFFDLGEDNWKDANDLNMLKLSVLAQAGVSEKLAVEPGAPAAGLVILLDETNATHPNAVAVFDDGAWVYFSPNEGWLVYNRSANYYEFFDGAVWAELETGGGGGGGGGGVSTVAVVAGTAYDLLAADASKYLVFTAATAKTVTVRPNATEALPADGEWHIRNRGASNLTLVAGAGVTLNVPAGGNLIVPTGGTVTLKRTAADVFDVMGVTQSATVLGDAAFKNTGTAAGTVAAGDDARIANALRSDLGGTVTASVDFTTVTGIPITSSRYGSGTTANALVLRYAHGTRGAPTGLLTGESTVFLMQGYAATQFRNMGAFSTTLIEPTPSDTMFGCAFRVQVPILGGTSTNEVVRFDHGSGFQMFGTNIVVDANRILRNRTYTVGAAPSPTGIAGAQFYCTNPTTGAARPYWSNGTNWYDAAGTLLA